MNYTKGEWEVTDTAFGRFSTHRGKNAGARQFVTVALSEVAEAQGDTEQEATANAHLIAAAPDMYEALKVLEQWATQKLEYNQEVAANYNFIANARKALAKAEGREK